MCKTKKILLIAALSLLALTGIGLIVYGVILLTT